jgi:hypothetical protein
MCEENDRPSKLTFFFLEKEEMTGWRTSFVGNNWSAIVAPEFSIFTLN